MTIVTRIIKFVTIMKTSLRCDWIPFQPLPKTTRLSTTSLQGLNTLRYVFPFTFSLHASVRFSFHPPVHFSPLIFPSTPSGTFFLSLSRYTLRYVLLFPFNFLFTPPNASSIFLFPFQYLFSLTFSTPSL